MHQAVTFASITSDIGSIFHPLFWAFAQVLALFYSLIPNYIIAITLLTVLVMLLDGSSHRQEHQIDDGDAADPA